MASKTTAKVANEVLCVCVCVCVCVCFLRNRRRLEKVLQVRSLRPMLTAPRREPRVPCHFSYFDGSHLQGLGAFLLISCVLDARCASHGMGDGSVSCSLARMPPTALKL